MTPVRARTGPALVVVGIALAVLVGGFALALAGGRHASPGGPAIRRVSGVALPARSAAALLRGVSRGGEPPADVASALVVPAASVLLHANRPPPAVNLYSGTVTLSVAAPAREVVTFFRRELPSRRFAVVALDATADGRGTSIFARYPSNDGFYWEAGIVVTPAAAAITPALGGGAPTSTVSLTVLELDDPD